MQQLFIRKKRATVSNSAEGTSNTRTKYYLLHIEITGNMSIDGHKNMFGADSRKKEWWKKSKSQALAIFRGFPIKKSLELW